jgi:hypothetical protein
MITKPKSIFTSAAIARAVMPSRQATITARFIVVDFKRRTLV